MERDERQAAEDAVVRWVKQRVALSDDDEQALRELLDELEEGYFQFGSDVAMPI